MNEAVPQLFDAPDDAEVAARARAWLRSEPVALLRVATFIAQSGRQPPAALTRAANEELGTIDRLAPAAAREELTQALVARDVQLALQWLHDVGALAKLIPEIEATVDFSQESGRKH